MDNENKYKIGDIVKVVDSSKGVSKKVKQAEGGFLIILRVLDNGRYLCAIGNLKRSCHTVKVSTNKGEVFAFICKTYSVSDNMIIETDRFLLEAKAQTDFILRTIERRKLAMRERRKQKRLTALEKQRLQTLKKKERRKQKLEKETPYIRAYELAVMSNDRVRMSEIEEELGYAPIGRGKKSRSYYYIKTKEFKR